MLWQVILLVCCSALVNSDETSRKALSPHGDYISDADADQIADDILSDLDGESTEKLFQVLTVPDPESIPDEAEEGDSKENVFEIAPRFNWGKFGTTLLKVAKSIGQATRTKLLSFFRNLRKATKYVLNKISEGTKKIWEKLKSKFGGDFKNKVRKAGKKLVKKVLKEVYEEAAEMAVEYVQALIIDYLHYKSQEELCECPMESDPDRCRCCINPPGFAKACLVIRARPKLKWFVFSFRYNGTEFMKAKIAEDDRGPCQKGIEDLSRKVCQNLPHYLHFLHICFIPGDIYEIDGDKDGFVGCFRLTVDSLKLGVEKCVIYQKTDKGIGVTSLFSATELGLEDE